MPTFVRQYFTSKVVLVKFVIILIFILFEKDIIKISNLE